MYCIANQVREIGKKGHALHCSSRYMHRHYTPVWSSLSPIPCKNHSVTLCQTCRTVNWWCCQKGRRDWVILAPWVLQVLACLDSSQHICHYKAHLTHSKQLGNKHAAWRFVRIAELSVNLHHTCIWWCCQKGRRDWVILAPWALQVLACLDSSQRICHYKAHLTHSKQLGNKHAAWRFVRIAELSVNLHYTCISWCCQKGRRDWVILAPWVLQVLACLDSSQRICHYRAHLTHSKQLGNKHAAWRFVRIAELSVNLHYTCTSDDAVRKGAEIGSS